MNNLKNLEASEPILQENKSRHVLYPIEHSDLFTFYKKAVASFWVADEIDFGQDLVQLDKLSDDEKHFIFHVLAFFAASDGVVMENLSMRFSNEVPCSEVRAFYAIQNAIEAIHSETYSLLIDTYVRRDEEQKARLFDAVKHFDAIRQKAEWGLRWISDKESSFSQRLVAFAITEGVFFSSSFASIFWLRKRGLLPGLTFANELISRDEAMHTDFAVCLYSKLEHTRLEENVIHDMFKEAVEIERHFITDAIPCSMIGMNADLMIQYIEFVADRLLVQLGYKKIWNRQNPFEFMEISAAHTVTNFFEQRVSQYQRSCVNTKAEKLGQSGVPAALEITEDF